MPVVGVIHFNMLLRAHFKLILIFVFTVFGMIFSPNYSYSDWEVKDFEKKIMLKIIPKYCAYMQLAPRAGSRNADRYKEYLGEGWRHTHHYCWGLDKMHLALLNVSVESQYKHHLRNAISEFHYVLKRVSDHFILKPEILTRQGMAWSLLGRDAEATHAFLSAIQLKPDYVYSYIELSKLYSKNGKIEEARKVLNSALEHSPNSPRLKPALAKLEKK
jgi:tetratricopeptide (TPR) repeat protein